MGKKIFNLIFALLLSLTTLSPVYANEEDYNNDDEHIHETEHTNEVENINDNYNSERDFVSTESADYEIIVETTPEQDIEIYPYDEKDLEDLSEMDFRSKRLIVSTSEEFIVEKDTILAKYEPVEGYPVFLLQFNTEEDVKKAYLHYLEIAEQIDVDVPVIRAEDDETEYKDTVTDQPAPDTPSYEGLEPTEMSEEENPLNELNNQIDSDIQQVMDESEEEITVAEARLMTPMLLGANNSEKVIALLDTGVGRKTTYDRDHVVNRVSMISDSTNPDGYDDNGHGNAMYGHILDEAPNAKILSVKVLNNEGTGDLSALYAGIMYAIEQNVDIISMSLSAYQPGGSSLVDSALQQAINKGIIVVAAAGNDGRNAQDYVPANIDNVITVGAAKVNGTRQELSNYGDVVEYNVIANSTSEATARLAGIIYRDGLDKINQEINTDEVYSPDYVPTGGSATPEGQGQNPGLPGQVTTPSNVTIESLSDQVAYGAKLENGKWVKTPTTNTKGQRYTFRVNYSTSGVGESPKGEIRFTIPKSVLLDRNNNLSDTFEMSVPHENEWDASDDVDFVYYVDGDNIILYNIRELDAAVNGYFEASYLTNKTTFQYQDMKANNPFNVVMSVGGKTQTATDLVTYMNTKVEIVSTNKEQPTTLYRSWQSSWGDKPADADDYYFLIWRTTSDVYKDSTQPYTFTINDTVLSEGSVVGYKMAYQNEYTSINSADAQNATGKRYDYVLTKHLKSRYDLGDSYWIFKNKITSTVVPQDGVDSPTSQIAQREYRYKVPRFTIPSGQFNQWNHADGYWRYWKDKYGYGTTMLSYLGNKANEYTRYDLDELKDGYVDHLPNFDYAVYEAGYPYQWTYEDVTGNGPLDYQNYGIRPVKFELINNDEMYLDDFKLNPGDYQIDYLSFGWTMNDAIFNEDEQEFEKDSVTYTDTDIVTFYGNFGDGNLVEIGTYNLKTKTYDFDTQYIQSVEKIGRTDNIRLFPVDGMVGYKLETENAHFFTQLDTVPNYRLIGTERVLEYIRNLDDITLINKSHGTFTENNGRVILTVDTQDDNYARIIERESDITKKIISTANNTKKKFYNIGWKISMNENYTIGDGETYAMEQESGTFYDLLPIGGNIILDSVAVRSDKGYLSDNSFDVSTIPNYRDSGRTLLVVNIKEPGNFYDLYYDTNHPWDSIKDYGNDVYNPVAYETGNKDIANGLADTGGELNDKELLSNLDPESTTKRFIYADALDDIATVTAALSGLNKKVKTDKDNDYSYDTVVSNNGLYQYRLRFMNSYVNSAKDIVLFDDLENYQVEDGATSDWTGILQSIDLQQIKNKGINPVLYINTNHVDFTQYDKDTPVNTILANWTRVTDSTDLSQAKAIAIDMRKATDGSDFVLDQGESVTAVVYMKAPNGAADPDGGYPETYNNIYIHDTVIGVSGDEETFFIHQDYTTVRLLITQDLKLHKTSAEDENTEIPNIKFRLKGTSDYGTEIDEIKSTDRRGSLKFNDVEKGTYILQEYETTRDWLLDTTEYVVVINGSGELTINGQNYTDITFDLTNRPRVHGDLTLLKRREGDSADDLEFKQLVSITPVGGTFTFDDFVYEVIEKVGNKAKIRKQVIAYPYIDSTRGAYQMHSDGKPIFWLANVLGKAAGESRDYTLDLPYIVFSEMNQGEATLYDGDKILVDWDVEMVGGFEAFDFEFYKKVLLPNENRQTAWTSISDSGNLILNSTKSGIYKVTASIGNNSDYCYVVIPGDISRDSFIQSNDSGIILRYAGTNGITPPINDIFTDALADVNGDKRIQASDANALMIYSSASGTENNYTSDAIPQDLSGAVNGEYWVSMIANAQAPISNTTFKLYGISDYGNDVLEIKTTNSYGRLEFENIELGTYILEEITPNDDYILNTTKWTVKVDEQGNVSVIEPEDETLRDRLYQVENAGNAYSVFNEPRYWNFTLRKVDKENETIWIQGAEFTLNGISDLGTEYNKVVKSNENGRVIFDRIEKGTYVLKETKAPTGVTETGAQGGNRNYIADPKEYIVKIDYKGDVTIDGLKTNDYGDFVVKNDRAYDGKITIVKKWDDDLTDNNERPEPVVHLSTNEPQFKRGITVTKVWEGDTPEDRPEDITVYLGEKVTREQKLSFITNLPFEDSTVATDHTFEEWVEFFNSLTPYMNSNPDSVRIKIFNSPNYSNALIDNRFTSFECSDSSCVYYINNESVPAGTIINVSGGYLYEDYDEAYSGSKIEISAITGEYETEMIATETSRHNLWTKNQDNTWTYTFDILLEDENADKEFYVWEEDSVEGYKVINNSNNPVLVENQKATISNTYEKNRTIKYDGSNNNRFASINASNLITDGLSKIGLLTKVNAEDFEYDFPLSPSFDSDIVVIPIKNNNFSEFGQSVSLSDTATQFYVATREDYENPDWYERFTNAVRLGEGTIETTDLKNIYSNTPIGGMYNLYDIVYLVNNHQYVGEYAARYGWVRDPIGDDKSYLGTYLDVDIINSADGSLIETVFIGNEESTIPTSNGYNFIPRSLYSRLTDLGGLKIVDFRVKHVYRNDPNNPDDFIPDGRNVQLVLPDGTSGSFTYSGSYDPDFGDMFSYATVYYPFANLQSHENKMYINNSGNIRFSVMDGIEYSSGQGINENNRWVKDDDTWTYTFDVFDDSIPYYIWEEKLDGYTSTVMMPNFDIMNENGEKYYEILNTSTNRSSLEISKIVKDTVTDQKFDFTITIDDWSGTFIKSGVIFTDGVAHIKLAHGESKLIEGLPAGKTYTITEEQVKPFETTSTGETGTLQAGTKHEATFMNTWKNPKELAPENYQNVMLRKVVDGKYETSGLYTFFVSFNDLEPKMTHELSNGDTFIADENGAANISVQLRADEEIIIKDLPVNSFYQITEEAGDYTSSYTVTGQEAYDKYNLVGCWVSEDYLDAHDPVRVQCFNTDGTWYMLDDNTNSNTPTSTEGRRWNYINQSQKNFRIELDMHPPGHDMYTSDWNSVFIDNDTWKFSNNEVAAAMYRVDPTTLDRIYTDLEHVNAGIDAIVTQSSGYSTGEQQQLSTALEKVDQDEDVVVVTFKNTLKKTENIKIKKEVTGTEDDKKIAFGFVLTLEGLEPNGRYDSSIGRFVADEEGWVQKEFLLRDGEEVVIEGLPVGSTYQVTEKKNAFTASYVIEDNNGLDKIGVPDNQNDEKNKDLSTATETVNEGEDITVTFRNVRNEVIIKLKKIVDGNMGNKTDKFNFTVQINDREPDTYELGHGEEIEIEIPINATYTITEQDYSSEGYRTYINNGLLQSRDITETATKDDEIVFKNIRGAAVPTEIRFWWWSGIPLILIPLLYIIIKERQKKQLNKKYLNRT